MRKIATLILALVYLVSNAQEPNGRPVYPGYSWYKYDYLTAGKGLFNAQRDTNWTPSAAGVQVYMNGFLWQWDGGKWNSMSGESQATNIAWVGVRSDGTDNTAKINAAISGGGKFYFPAGTYLISSPLIIPSNTELIGDFNKTIIAPYNGYAGKAVGDTTGTPLTNISIRNIKFRNLSTVYFDHVTNLTIDHCEIDTALGTKAIQVISCIGAWITNNLIDSAAVMGISTEGGLSGALKYVHITNNTVKNTGDDGIVIRAINGSVYNTEVIGNILYKTGKAGIKNTIEVGSKDTVTFQNFIVANNVINIWARKIKEDAISCDSYKPGRFIYHGTITGNVVISDTVAIDSPYNGAGTRSYITAVRNINTTMGNNTAYGYCGRAGYVLDSSFGCTATGNIGSGAGQWYKDTANIDVQAGFYVNNCRNVTVSNNSIKNSGTTTLNLPGIRIKQTDSSIFNGNRCYDDQAVKTQQYGMYETNDGGDGKWSQDNIFVGNHCAGNVTQDMLVSLRSKKYVNFDDDPFLADHFKITNSLGSKGIEWYNTDDMITNTEKVYARWGANIFSIRTASTGTGTPRDIQFGTLNRIFTIHENATTGASSSGIYDFTYTQGTNNAGGVAINSNLIANGGNSMPLYVNASVNESATGGFNLIHVNANQVTLGSGDNNLIKATTGINADTVQFSVSSTGNVTLKGLTSSGNTPSISAGVSAGTTPTISITGNNVAGVIALTAGTSPTAAGVIATITFSEPLSRSPRVVMLSPGNTNAGGAVARVYVNQGTMSTASFELKNTSTALTAGTQYTWFYQVIQ